MPNQKTEAEITRGLLGLELYVIETGPARSERTRTVLPEHIAHHIRLEREGILIAAGPMFVESDEIPSKGMIGIRAASFGDARRIADSDPFHAQGIQTYSIREWVANAGALNARILLSDQSVSFS